MRQNEDAKLNHGFSWQKQHSANSRRKRRSFFASKLDLNLRKQLVKCCIWSIALYGAETRTHRKVDQEYVESFEMWRWRRVEKISRTECVRNKEVLT
jgi:hypothetical protein